MRKASPAFTRNNWQPFYLTSVLPSDTRDVTQSLSISDIISSDSFAKETRHTSTNSASPATDIDYACLINYMVEPDWLFNACPLLQCVPVLLLHGHRGLEIGSRSNLIVSQVDMGQEQYGTHHSKIMIVFYNSGVRIAIGTANLIEVDWTTKTQGFYVQDFPLKAVQAPSSQSAPSSAPSSSSQLPFKTEPTDSSNLSSGVSSSTAQPDGAISFERDLTEYLRNVVLYSPIAQRMLADRVVARLPLYDFRSAEVVLVPSVPGRHPVSRPAQGVNINRWGHLKLRDSLRYHKSLVESRPTPAGPQNSFGSSSYKNEVPSSIPSRSSGLDAGSSGEACASVLVMQASSVSTMGKNDEFAAELAASMDAGPDTETRFVWPTVETVRLSLGGYSSGMSLPCSSKV